MRTKFIHYFLPIFISGYFIVAFIPILAQKKTEIFPFFSFKLYSKVPSMDFEKYDLLYNEGTPNEFFLFHNNLSLTGLEKRNHAHQLRVLTQEYTETNDLSVSPKLKELLKKGETVKFVKISGNYVEAVRDKEFQVETIIELK